MIFEIVLIITVITTILFFFYKQAVKEFRILQTETMDGAVPLFSERSPIVIHPAPKPMELWTLKDLSQRPALKKQIDPFLSKKSSWLEPKHSQELATQVGLPIWVNHTLMPTFKNLWWGPLLWAQTRVMIGAQGLRPTFGFWTIILATEGKLQVSLLNESSDSYLPKQWLGKRLSKITRDEAPLLAQIQFVDVVVRPGSALLIPPPWKVCCEAEGPTLGVWIDVHHPVSYIAQQAFYRKMQPQQKK
jgi:hypothetical protein